MAHAILKAHNTGDNMEELAIRFDAMASHDITYVGIIQTARPPACRRSPCPMCSPTATTPCAPWGAPSTRTTMCSAVGGEVRRRVCPRPPERHSFLYAGAVRRPRQDDPGLRLPHPLRRLRHHGHRRGRSGAGPAALSKLITSRTRRSSPSTSPARPSPVWAPRTWRWSSSAPPSKTEWSRTR